ncbi:hypothetical protein [Mycobacterium sp. 852014-50255_SCH5639931]|uniref:Rv1733c family protein n=1 Tax=Mycobacterium sp. 852014-50255_SCH5639931 TaxID=1834112 RepID=UPI0007FD3246|nr:hypothetical protein [Mycobacterium sp. 852014-50255_SCH5639931]OBB65860.1 hypothetical protein A5758_16175 [Mycobacterium sp. 852014-50255_SCH5639931]
MTTPRHDPQPRSAHPPDDHAVLETFTVPLPRRLFTRLLGRNPLVRASDRVEALLVVLAVAVSLFTVPVAATVGTAVHESRSRVYAEQIQTRRPVTATVVGDSHPRTDLESPTVRAPARWPVAGAERTGDVVAPLGVKIGDELEIWVDDEGSPVSRPKMSARDEAVAVAVAIWCVVSLSVAGLFAVARDALDRARYARWQHDFNSLVEQR